MANVDDVLKRKYPAKDHARRVAEYIGVKSGIIYLEAQKTHLIEDNDEPVPFRSRPWSSLVAHTDSV